MNYSLISYSAHTLYTASQQLEIKPGFTVVDKCISYGPSTGHIDRIAYLPPGNAHLAPAFMQTCEALDFVQEFKRWVASRQPYNMSLDHIRFLCDWADDILKKET